MIFTLAIFTHKFTRTKCYRPTFMAFAALVVLPIVSMSANASDKNQSTGLTLLTATLDRLSDVVHADISATLIAKNSRAIDDEESKKGLIELNLKEDQQGFAISYNQTTLKALEQERTLIHQQRLKEKQARNNKQDKSNASQESSTEPDKDKNKEQVSTIRGMKFLDPIGLRHMLSNASGLKRYIEKLNFIDEQVVTYQGQNARLLTFSVDMETIINNKKQQKHVDDFTGQYQIWTTLQGVPLESKMQFEGSGSYYLVFSVDLKQSANEKYAVVNNRLVVIESNLHNAVDSTFGSSVDTNHKTLTIKP